MLINTTNMYKSNIYVYTYTLNARRNIQEEEEYKLKDAQREQLDENKQSQTFRVFTAHVFSSYMILIYLCRTRNNLIDHKAFATVKPVVFISPRFYSTKFLMPRRAWGGGKRR